ncbi:MAG TPA: hypothetical protein PLS00_16675, partial [Niabella sp.]|nr:hypothetical protein [Niabella sp.]
LIKKDVFQLELFTDELVEVVDRDEMIRYVLRRNPARAEELKLTRQGKIDSINNKIQKSNKYLEEHLRAKTGIQIRDITAYIKKLKMDKFAEARTVGDKRQLELKIDETEMDQAAKLDGCYVIKSDLIDAKEIKKEELHSRYKSLSLVEWAFRTEKSQIEIRPIYLRKKHRTQAHLIVCMLAYKIEKYLRECWNELDLTVEEGMEKLSSIVGMKTKLGTKKEVVWLAEPDEMCKKLLSLAGVKMPSYLPAFETIVSTREKLPKHRK